MGKGKRKGEKRKGAWPQLQLLDPPVISIIINVILSSSSSSSRKLRNSVVAGIITPQRLRHAIVANNR